MTRLKAVHLGLLLIALAVVGCGKQPMMLPADQQRAIDRSIVEYPAATELRPVVQGLTAPSGIAFDADSTLIVAESGIGGHTPRIVAFKADGQLLEIFPKPRKFPYLGGDPFEIHAPIGGIAVHNGKIYVSHRDENGMGVITAFGYDGSHRTVVADLPCRGDNGITDLAFNPRTGRLWFGVGSATNSGVVGEDNYQAGWVRDYPKFCDQPWYNLKLLGYRFTTPNPRAGIGNPDILVTGPMQPLGVSNNSRVKRSEKPTSAIYSVSPTGGDLQVEAHGIRLPRGLRYNEFDRLYATNNGMELRGTRPIKNDPDAMLRIISNTYYGFPDYTSDLNPVTDAKYQPETWMVLSTGYPDVSFTLDHEASGLLAPDRNTLWQGSFPVLSGAAKFDFVPTNGAFREFRGNAVVALMGDREPFSTSAGLRLANPTGYKVMLLDVDSKVAKPFIHNVKEGPGSRHDEPQALERPIDAKFGPDGSLYIVDLGKLEMRGGKPRVSAGTGRIFKLVPSP